MTTPKDIPSANDNNLARAYLDFEADKDLFHWALMYSPSLVLGLKKVQGVDREGRVANFVWFLKFERSYKESEIENRRSKIEVVK